MTSVSDLLSQPERQWSKAAGANDAEIAELISFIDFDLPDEYLELLRFSNGGEGELALPPRWFLLYEIKEAINSRNDEFHRSMFPNFLFFGSNGGLEMIAFDLTKITNPIVMVDPIAGQGSAVEIAPNIGEFINAIGLEFNENA